MLAWISPAIYLRVQKTFPLRLSQQTIVPSKNNQRSCSKPPHKAKPFHYHVAPLTYQTSPPSLDLKHRDVLPTVKIRQI